MIQIFIQDVLNIDLALISPEFGLRGISLNVDVHWVGHKNSEGMLIDFSLAKKITRAVLNQEFDHKILVHSGQIRHHDHNKIICVEYNEEKLDCPFFFGINTHNNAIKKIAKSSYEDLSVNNYASLAKEISSEIIKQAPENISDIKIILKRSESHKQPYSFNYTHNLCYHSGNCQRFHGHSSQVRIFKNKKLDLNLSNVVAKHLDGRYIVYKKYLRALFTAEPIREIYQCAPEIENIKDQLHTAEYQGSQGLVSLIISKYLCLEIKEESTIENLAEYVLEYAKKNSSQLNSDPIEVEIFEGISKGTIVS